MLLYEGAMSSWLSGEDQTKIRIAAVGTAEDRLLQMGYAALESMDSSRFSLELIQMEEEEARTALQDGEISAYVIFPEGFMDKALRGEIMPLHFVSAAGSPDVFSLIKEELTSALSKVLLASEYSAFGLGDALDAWGKPELSGEKMNEISIYFVGLLLNRENLYTVEELGISDGIGFSENLISGISVILIFMVGLPFASVLIKDSLALEQQLCSRGVNVFSQVICEYFSFFVFMLALIAAPVLLISDSVVDSFLKVVPAVACVCAIGFFLYSICKDILGGILLYICTCVALCFVSGCMYPVYFFPLRIQQLAAYLPASAARRQMAATLFDLPATDTALLLAMTAVFLFMTFMVRQRRMRSGRRAGK